MRIWVFKGQIAVFLVLLMAVIFLFMVITMNIGQISQQKTIVSQAADGAALMHASLRSSYGASCWRQIKANSDFSGASSLYDHKPGDEWSHEKVDWTNVLTAPILIFVAVLFHQWWLIPLIALSSYGLKAGLIDSMSLKAQNRILAGLMQSLPDGIKTAEMAIGYALSMVVDDPNLKTDKHDIDQDGDTTDKVLAFANWRAENLAALVGGEVQLKWDLRDEIKDFLRKSEKFRMYLGGIPYPQLRPPSTDLDSYKEQYPEFANNPQWKTEYDLQGCTDACIAKYSDPTTAPPCNYTDEECATNCQKQIDRLTPEAKSLLLMPVNQYYPQDDPGANYLHVPTDGLMRLLADFEAVNLPRDGSGEKPPLSIMNVNISRLSEKPPVLSEYSEAIKYDFKFWAVDEAEAGDEGKGMAYIVRKKFDCPGGVGVPQLLHAYPTEPSIWPSICPDNVDFMIQALEGFRGFAYGQHTQELWDWTQMQWTAPDRPPEAALPADKICSYYHDLRWLPGVTSYSNFDAQRNFNTWVRSLINIEDYKPVVQEPGSEGGGSTGPTEAEIAEKEARYEDTQLASVELMLLMLGSTPGGGVGDYSYFIGWHGDLQRVKNTVPFFGERSDVAGNPAYKGLNGKRQELKDKMDTICSKIKGISAEWDCSSCYNVLCVTDGLRQINERITAIGAAMADIGNILEAIGDCENINCGCDEDDDECLNNQAQCETNKQNCFANANTTGKSKDELEKELEDLGIQLAALNTVLGLANKMLVLAPSLEYVEQLIGRINTAQARIENFWNAGNNFYWYVKGKAESGELYDVYTGKRENPPEIQVVYSWQTKNVLDPDHPFWHHVRVTASNPPMPMLKAKRELLIFGKKAYIEHPEDDVSVKVERFDEDKLLSLGGKKNFNWLNWLFHSTTNKDMNLKDSHGNSTSLANLAVSNDPEDKRLYEAIVEDPKQALPYGVQSSAKAHYTPRLYYKTPTIWQNIETRIIQTN
jgi:hypothetical protein